MFEEKKDPQGLSYRIIAWTEYGLSKIDLSEIDFSNVLWQLEEVVDMSNSNAKIDFETSFDRILSANDAPVRVINFNLENVDLHDAHANLIGYSSGSNYKGTNMQMNSLEGKKFINCNLEGFDFRNMKLFSAALTSESVTSYVGTSFTGTGVTIEMKEDHKEVVAEEIRNGHLYGCYVNGTYIPDPSSEETQKKKEEILEQYKRFEWNYHREFDAEMLRLRRLKAAEDSYF